MGYSVGPGDQVWRIAAADQAPDCARGDAGVWDAGFAELHGGIEHDSRPGRPFAGDLILELQAAEGNQVVLEDGHGELTVLAGRDESLAKVRQHIGLIGPHLLGGKRPLTSGVLAQPRLGGVDAGPGDAGGAQRRDDAHGNKVLKGDGQVPARHISQVRVRQALADPADQMPRGDRVGPVGRARGQQVAGRGGRSLDALVHAYCLDDGSASMWRRRCLVTSLTLDWRLRLNWLRVGGRVGRRAVLVALGVAEVDFVAREDVAPVGAAGVDVVFVGERRRSVRG